MKKFFHIGFLVIFLTSNIFSFPISTFAQTNGTPRCAEGTLVQQGGQPKCLVDTTDAVKNVPNLA